MTQSTSVNPAFSSGDFGKVPALQVAHQADRLLHPDVLGAELNDDQALSNARKHLVRTIDLPSRVISMTLGGLAPGQATGRHRHNYETIIYVLAGSGYSLIGERRVAWRAGDAFYVPVWAWHQHFNESSDAEARYLACENAPMLQNLGIAMREEA